MEPNPTDLLRAAVEAQGGTSAAARKMNITKQRLYNWLKRGAPWRACEAIEKHLGVKRQAMRPNDWQKRWPELARRAERQARAAAKTQQRAAA